MPPKRVFVIVLVVVVLLGIFTVIVRQETYDDEVSKITPICTRFPYLSFCRRSFKPKPRSRPDQPPRVDIANIKKRAFCVAGGGTLSQSTAHGIIASILKHKREGTGNRELKIKDILKDVNIFSGSSGGNVFLALLAYDRIYNDSINDIRNLTAERTAENFYNTYISTFNNIRDEADEFDQELLSSLELPYFLRLFLEILTIDSPGVLGLGGIRRLGQAYLLDRHINTKMKNTLPDYNNTNVIIAGSLVTTANVNIEDGRQDISYTYNIPTGEDNCRDVLPFEHGPLTSRTNIDGIDIKEYRSKTLDSMRLWDGWSTQPGPLPDNKMFDTGIWRRKREDGWFSNPELPYRVYRSKNVSASDCCQNNSESNKCTSASLVTFASKSDTIPFSREGIYNDKTEYYAYNIETEKNPTGDWEDEVTGSIPDVAYKLVADVSTKLDSMIYDTSEELLNNVIGVTTALPGIIKDPCLVKSAIYRGGFSDQELFASRFLKLGIDLSVYVKTNDTLTPNRRLYPTICDAAGCNRVDDVKTQLSKIAKAQPLCLFDAAGCDNTGVLPAVLAFQTDNRFYKTQTLEIFTIVRVESELGMLFKRNPLLVTEEKAQKGYDAVTDTVDAIMDVVNDVANFNVFQEAALIAGYVSAASIVYGLSSLLSPILGIALTSALVTATSEIVWEALDLDTDYHVTTDRFGKTFNTQLHFRAPTIFSTAPRPSEEYNTTIDNSNGEAIPFSLKYYENLKTVDHPLHGIKKGTTVNLTAIICESTGQLISFFGDGKNFEDTVKYSFEGIEKTYMDPIGSRILQRVFS